jgi:class 3 adenylate cyclase
LLDDHDALIRRQVERFGGRAVKSTGDGLLATFDGPARGIRCGAAIIAAARQLGLQARVGVHAGEIEWRGDDVAGVAVHISARIAGLAAPSELLVSTTVRDLVAGSGLSFVSRGDYELKGLPEPWRLFAVDTAAPS